MKKNEYKKLLLVGIALVVVALVMKFPFSVYTWNTLKVNQQAAFTFSCNADCISTYGVSTSGNVVFYVKYGSGSKYIIGSAPIVIISGIAYSEITYTPTQAGLMTIYAEPTSFSGYIDSTPFTVADVCTSQCTAGQSKCEGAHYYQCQQVPTTSCSAWVDLGVQTQCQPSPQCPANCPPATEWSLCSSSGTQNRVNYRCNEATGYVCQSYLENRQCTITLPACPYTCCNPGEGYEQQICLSGSCIDHNCVDNCVPNLVCNDWSSCDPGTLKKYRDCNDGCGGNSIESQSCSIACNPPTKPCDGAVLNEQYCTWDTSGCDIICGTLQGWRVSGNTCVLDSGCAYDANSYTYYSNAKECLNTINNDLFNLIASNILYIAMAIVIILVLIIVLMRRR